MVLVTVMGINGDPLVQNHSLVRRERVRLVKEELAGFLGHSERTFRLLLGAEELAERHIGAAPDAELLLTAVFEIGPSSIDDLLEAARRGFHAELRKRLDAVASEVRREFVTNTPALSNPGTMEVVLANAEKENLLQESLLAQDAHGNTALHLFAKQGNAGMARELVSKSAEGGKLLQARGQCGLTPLHVAAREGHANVASVLLDACGSGEELRRLLAVRDEASFGLLIDGTALARAVQRGHAAVVQVLLQAAAGHDWCPSLFWEGCGHGTALHLAIANRQSAAMSALLEEESVRRDLLLRQNAAGEPPLTVAEDSRDAEALLPPLLKAAHAEGLSRAALRQGEPPC